MPLSAWVSLNLEPFSMRRCMASSAAYLNSNICGVSCRKNNVNNVNYVGYHQKLPCQSSLNPSNIYNTSWKLCWKIRMFLHMLAYTGIFFWFGILCALNLLNDPVRWRVPDASRYAIATLSTMATAALQAHKHFLDLLRFSPRGGSIWK